MSAMRTRNLKYLLDRGFRVAGSLPTIRSENPPAMRPASEVAERLFDLGTLFLWVAASEEEVSSESLSRLREQALARNGTPDEEAEILQLPRRVANEFHAETIGWRLENMWALAWVLGFEPKPELEGMIENRVRDTLLWSFMKLPESGPNDLLAWCTPRDYGVVDEAEDLFYCAHNAVRSAQLGADTVPHGCHPVIDGGGVHERRHSLTWVLSPGVAWDDTDLST